MSPAQFQHLAAEQTWRVAIFDARRCVENSSVVKHATHLQRVGLTQHEPRAPVLTPTCRHRRSERAPTATFRYSMIHLATRYETDGSPVRDPNRRPPPPPWGPRLIRGKGEHRRDGSQRPHDQVFGLGRHRRRHGDVGPTQAHRLEIRVAARHLRPKGPLPALEAA